VRVLAGRHPPGYLLGDLRRLLGGAERQAGRQLRALAISPLTRQRLTMFVSRHRQADLETLRQLTESGQVTPVIGETYPLAAAPQAIRHLRAGHAQGKLAITI
jgi:NADPH:quinone reductase-like Zn-dependent oxidoreductase